MKRSEARRRLRRMVLPNVTDEEADRLLEELGVVVEDDGPAPDRFTVDEEGHIRAHYYSGKIELVAELSISSGAHAAVEALVAVYNRHTQPRPSAPVSLPWVFNAGAHVPASGDGHYLILDGNNQLDVVELERGQWVGLPSQSVVAWTGPINRPFGEKP